MGHDTKAGEGNPHNYRILSNQDPAKNYEPGKCYIGIDAVTWFVNGKSSFFTDRMVAGTVGVTVNGEDYPVVLGQFELKDGQQVAPIFNKSIIESVPYNAGNVKFDIVIAGTKHDTMAGTLLKQMSAATLTAVAGAVTLETGGVGGIALAAAGGVLVKGAQEVLTDNNDKKVPIFNHYEVGIRPVEDLSGDKSYILIHRGEDGLKDSKFSITTGTGGIDVYYDGSPFRDGAWLLLCIRRSGTYVGTQRPWLNDLQELQGSFDELMDTWKSTQINVDDVKKSLKRSETDSPTLADQVNVLSRRIRSDKALIMIDRGKYAGVIRAYLNAANHAVTANDPQKYFDEINGINKTLKDNAPKTQLLEESIFKELVLALTSSVDISQISYKGDAMFYTGN